MDSTRRTASSGLLYLFIGEIVGLFVFIPFIGLLVPIAAAVISIYGFYTLSKATPTFNTAFMLTIANLIVSVLGVIFRTGFTGFVIDVAAVILSFLVVYYVCQGASELLRGISDHLVGRANTIWVLYLICAVIVIICYLLAIIPFINILAALVSFIMGIVQLIASILYIIFLWSSHKALQ